MLVVDGRDGIGMGMGAGGRRVVVHLERGIADSIRNGFISRDVSNDL